MQHRPWSYWRRRRLAALTLVFALLITAAAAPIRRQAKLAAPDASALGATQEVLKDVSRIRQLAILQPVRSGFKSHDQIEQSVIQDLDESTSAEEFEASSKTLAKLGLIPRGFQLRDYVIKLLREQVAGYYEPKTRFFYLASWLPVSEQKSVMAHELTHALQDQHFNLRRFEHWPKGDSDAELAAHSLVEGEATLVMLQYAAEQEGWNLDVSKIGSLRDRMIEQESDSDSAKYPILSAAPMVLRENLQFPYIYGLGFAQDMLRARSWAGLDESYKRLPASSKQIMHPDLYLADDEPVKIQIADIGSVLGKDWKRADDDVNGEFGYFVMLKQFIDQQTAQTASDGWSGDRYQLYENPAGSTVLVQYTTWDSERMARRFFDAYIDRSLARYNARQFDQPAASGKWVLETGEGLVSVELRGSDVVMVEGARDSRQLSALMAALWTSRKLARY